MKLLKKFSFLRETLDFRDEQLMLASRRNITQEYIIQELRQFIHESLLDALKIMDELGEGTGKV